MHFVILVLSPGKGVPGGTTVPLLPGWIKGRVGWSHAVHRPNTRNKQRAWATGGLGPETGQRSQDSLGALPTFYSDSWARSALRTLRQTLRAEAARWHEGGL